MLDEMNTGLEKLAEEPYEEIKKYEIKTRKLSRKDFEHALERMKPATTKDMVRRYEEWNERFGAL